MNLPALIPGQRAHDQGGAGRMDAGFAAQLLGATGQRRGLRGGETVLAQARSAYLRAEWSGPADRRPSVGAAKTTQI